ncbi:hypothetical protein BDQ17DRAFT_461777 [Cyathus striatus]|nr:hypothetical protein BDQ17DRAFT_461777 [Cyathus striatus]
MSQLAVPLFHHFFLYFYLSSHADIFAPPQASSSSSKMTDSHPYAHSLNAPSTTTRKLCTRKASTRTSTTYPDGRCRSRIYTLGGREENGVVEEPGARSYRESFPMLSFCGLFR